MKWNSGHVHLLMKRKTAIELLPNVKPLKAKWLIDAIKDHFDNHIVAAIFGNDDEAGAYEINGYRISEEDYTQMLLRFTNDYGDEVDYITPEGANILIEMYQNECFELKKKSEGLGNTHSLADYAASAESILERYKDEVEYKKQQRAQEAHWKEHPEELPEKMFTASRLNAIMWHHGINGMHSTMEIGGIKVTKVVSFYTSNSGKSRDSEVVLRWTGSDGIPREEFLRSSVYQHNRRNDAGRNWGLHE